MNDVDKDKKKCFFLRFSTFALKEKNVTKTAKRKIMLKTEHICLT